LGLLAETTFQKSAWTVSEVTDYIKELFEIDFRLQEIEVEGEISNFTQARSGHLYFTLKDESAQIKCVMWRSSAQRMAFRPQEGDAVIIRGRVSVYESGGVYQLYADSMDPAGRGDLALAFERLKERLSAEGLFDQANKQSPPPFPEKLGIVTSADAAALRDILNVLKRRCPLVSVLIAPTLVQGDQAPAQIVRALQWLDGRSDIDLIILARGGGSIEDLWTFNNENVARAIYEAQHPIISGIGHETDFTIADFVADLRAPTPSAAAELAVPDLSELPFYLHDLRLKILSQTRNLLRQKYLSMQTQFHKLNLLSPRGSLDNNRQKLDIMSYRLEQAMNQRLQQIRGRLAVAMAGLTATSPLATLSRGYAIVRREDGPVVRSTKQVAASERINIQISDGTIKATVDDAAGNLE